MPFAESQLYFCISSYFPRLCVKSTVSNNGLISKHYMFSMLIEFHQSFINQKQSLKIFSKDFLLIFVLLKSSHKEILLSLCVYWFRSILFILFILLLLSVPKVVDE